MDGQSAQPGIVRQQGIVHPTDSLYFERLHPLAVSYAANRPRHEASFGSRADRRQGDRSALVRLVRRGPAPSETVARLVRAAFAHRRKALAGSLGLAGVGLPRDQVVDVLIRAWRLYSWELYGRSWEYWRSSWELCLSQESAGEFLGTRPVFLGTTVEFSGTT